MSETFLLNSTLVREKFYVRDLHAKQAAPLIATGNRIVLPLRSKDGKKQERFVVRAKTMAATLRMAAAIMRDFYRYGSLLEQPQYDWKNTWAAVLSDYDLRFIPDMWGVVYTAGRQLFSYGTLHPFLDVIEQCDTRNAGDYELAMPMAEDFFTKAGKPVKIDYNSSIALVVGVMPERTRCGLIFRNPARSATFNFTVQALSVKRDATAPEPQMGLQHAAALLEAIQLAVNIGFQQAKIVTGVAFESEGVATQLTHMKKQFGRLNAEINGLESRYSIYYRPDKPDLFGVITEAEEYARLEPLREKPR